jgi:hypothetical protein
MKFIKSEIPLVAKNYIMILSYYEFYRSKGKQKLCAAHVNWTDEQRTGLIKTGKRKFMLLKESK